MQYVELLINRYNAVDGDFYDAIKFYSKIITDNIIKAFHLHGY
jgi:hypothetical protein